MSAAMFSATPALSEKIRILYDDITNSYNKDSEKVEETPSSEDNASEDESCGEEKCSENDHSDSEDKTEHEEWKMPYLYRIGLCQKCCLYIINQGVLYYQ